MIVLDADAEIPGIILDLKIETVFYCMAQQIDVRMSRRRQPDQGRFAYHTMKSTLRRDICACSGSHLTGNSLLTACIVQDGDRER